MKAPQQRRAVRGGQVGRVLRAARAARDMPRKALATDVGHKLEQVCRVELGTRALRVSQAVVWAPVLGCSLAELVQAVLQDQVTAAGVTLVVQVMESEGQ